MLAQQRNHFAQGARVGQFVVAKQEFYVFTAGLMEAMIPVVDHSQIGGMGGKTHTPVAGAKRPHDLGGIVGGTIVGDQQLKVLKILRQHRFNGLGQKAGVIIRRNQDADPGWIQEIVSTSMSGRLPQGPVGVKICFL